MPLRRAAGLAAGLMCGLVTTLACPAGAVPGPDDIAEARDEVHDRARQLGRAQADLATAHARLEDLQAEAELQIETYNGELVRLQQARVAYGQTAARMLQAERQVEAAREPLVAMVTGSYSDVALSRPLAVALADSSGLGDYLQRASMLSHLGGEQAAVVRRLHDMEEVYSILRGQSQRAFTAQRETTERVEVAKRAAERMVAAQAAQAEQIKREKEEISRRLDSARSRVERLVAAREAALRQSAAMAGLSVPSWAIAEAKQASSGLGGVAAQWALTQLGKPYVWAGAGPSTYDCSGLTMRAWEQAGIALDHWTGTQWTAGVHVPTSDLRSGDLVFFAYRAGDESSIHHVGIYIGRGLMVHAPQTGDVVRIASIWRPDLIGATRPGPSPL